MTRYLHEWLDDVLAIDNPRLQTLKVHTTKHYLPEQCGHCWPTNSWVTTELNVSGFFFSPRISCLLLVYKWPVIREKNLCTIFNIVTWHILRNIQSKQTHNSRELHSQQWITLPTLPLQRQCADSHNETNVYTVWDRQQAIRITLLEQQQNKQRLRKLAHALKTRTYLNIQSTTPTSFGLERFTV